MRKELYTAEVICDGESEVAYFEKLQELINHAEERCMSVKFHTSSSVHITKTVKSIRGIYGKNWFYVIDKESTSREHRNRFEAKLKEFKEIKKFDKKGTLLLGYSNISLELWLLWHKTNFSKPVNCAEDYWEHIKKAYGLNDILRFDAYKSSDIFKNRVLTKLTIEDVNDAIKRAEDIEISNQNIERIRNAHGFEYYEMNPSTSIHKIVKHVLKQVGLF